MPPIFTPFTLSSFEMFLSNGSIPRMNKTQLRASPCFTPFLIVYDPAQCPFSCIETICCLYNKSKIIVNSFKPICPNTLRIYQCSIESKAFSASKETTIIFLLSLLAFSIEYWSKFKLSVICLPLIYAVWFWPITSFTPSVSLSANVFVMILKSQFDSVMGRQFFKRLRSFPSLGNSFRYELSCEWVSTPVSSE